MFLQIFKAAKAPTLPADNGKEQVEPPAKKKPLAGEAAVEPKKINPGEEHLPPGLQGKTLKELQTIASDAVQNHHLDPGWTEPFKQTAKQMMHQHLSDMAAAYGLWPDNETGKMVRVGMTPEQHSMQSNKRGVRKAATGFDHKPTGAVRDNR